MTRWLAWLAIAGLATYLTFIGGAWAGIYTPALRVTSVLLAGGGLAVWAAVALRDATWRPRSVLLPAILLSLASLGISTVFSTNPRVSAEYLGYALILAALYLLLVRLLARPFFATRLATLAAILFAVISAAYLVLTGVHWLEWWGLVGRVTVPPLRPNHEGLTFLNPSAVLTMVALLAVPTAALALRPTRRGAVAGVVIAVVVGLVAVVSGSRAGWLALAGTTIVIGSALLASTGRRAIVVGWFRGIASTTTGRVALIAAGLLIAVGTITFGPAVLFRLGEGGDALRATYVVTALRMFEAAPLTGTGPGTWVIQRLAYTGQGEPDYYIPHAHNLEAQALAELGLLGVIAGTVVVAGLLALLRDAVRDSEPVHRRWAWLTAAGLVYVGLHQQLDFYANMPAVLFAMALPVAYLDASAGPGEPAARNRRWWPTTLQPPVALLGTGLLAVAIGALALQEIPASRMAAAVYAANRGDWSSADAAARLAAETDESIGAYQLMAGLAAVRTGDHIRAAASFDRVVAHDDLPEAWLNLAAVRELLGDAAGATAALEYALRLGVQRPAVAMPAGDLAMRLGLDRIAQSAFASSMLVTPSIAADPWWQANSARQAVFVRAVDEAIAAAPPHLAWEIALMTGDTGRARALAAAAGGSPTIDPLIDAWGGNEVAVSVVMERCRAAPYDIAGLTWCARIASRRGDEATATTWRRMADLLIGGSSNAGAELRVATDSPGSPAAGNPAVFWATFTYRRPGPFDLLVPSLVHLTLE